VNTNRTLQFSTTFKHLPTVTTVIRSSFAVNTTFVSAMQSVPDWDPLWCLQKLNSCRVSTAEDESDVFETIPESTEERPAKVESDDTLEDDNDDVDVASPIYRPTL